MIEYLSIKATPCDEPDETYPVGELREWANIDHGDDDVLLRTMAEGATDDIERESNVKITPHVVKIVVTATNAGEWVRLYYGDPCGLKVFDCDGAKVTATAIAGSLKLPESGQFTITYHVGDNAPKGLKEAVKMLVAYRYNNRGDQEKQTGLPDDIERKLSKYREVCL